MKTGPKLKPRSRILLARGSANREMKGLNDGSIYSAGLASEGYVGGYSAALSDVLLILDGAEPRVRPRFWETGKE